MGQQSNKKNTNIIRASEIGQYCYCSMAWYLQRCGYAPESPLLKKGTQHHIDFGHSLDEIQQKTTSSFKVNIIGYLFLFLSFVLLLLYFWGLL